MGCTVSLLSLSSAREGASTVRFGSVGRSVACTVSLLGFSSALGILEVLSEVLLEAMLSFSFGLLVCVVCVVFGFLFVSMETRDDEEGRKDVE